MFIITEFDFIFSILHTCLDDSTARTRIHSFGKVLRQAPKEIYKSLLLIQDKQLKSVVYYLNGP